MQSVTIKSIMLSVIMLSVIMLTFVMLNVVAPKQHLSKVEVGGEGEVSSGARTHLELRFQRPISH